MDTIEDLPTEEGLFPIRTVCAATGIHPVTLRAWERRYGLIRPKRTPKGHRLYSAEDIDLIKRVLRLLDQGVSIGQVGQLLELQEADEAPASQTPGESNTWGGYRMRLREAISGLDIQAVTALWEDALSLFSLDNCLSQLALPVQRSLAERPSSDQQARAELCFYSRWLRQTLETRLRQLRPGNNAPWIAAAPVHESPLNMDLMRFALAAAQRGLAVRLFTTGTPIAGLAPLAARSGARGIVLFSDADLPQTTRLLHWPEGEKAPLLPVFTLGSGFEPMPPVLEAAGVTPLCKDPDKAALRLHDQLRHQD